MQSSEIWKKVFMAFFFGCFSFLLSIPIYGENSKEALSQGITVDLRHPCYSNGVLSTEQGGVITGPDVRIQAMHITYTRKMENEEPVCTIIAEGSLILELGRYIFVGDRLEYDFQTKTGVVYNGRTMIEPWFFGGKIIHLLEDGNYFIENAYATTSENYLADWEILAEEALLTEGSYLDAEKVQFRIMQAPVFWLPSFHTNLDSIFDSPIRYNVKWGGRQGHRFGLIYEVFSWKGWKTFLRLDYRLKRGPGGGVETHYVSEDRKTSFESINYVASDSSILHPGQRIRYRLQGLGRSLLLEDKISVYLSYDKLSDMDMPTDYNDRGLELDTAGRTEFLVRRQEEHWIANFITRLRLNNFQTIKQQLPTFETTWHPFELGFSGIIADIPIKASYLDFAYGNNQIHLPDYHSLRTEFSPLLYRHFTLGALNATPEVGAVSIVYGNSPQSTAKWLVLGKFGCTVNTHLYRQTDSFKHVITPYARYEYYTMPTVSPNGHYIFDIEDGWYRLNLLLLGISQSLCYKQKNGLITRQIYADFYTNLFLDTHTLPQIVPKVYADLTFNSSPFLKHSLHSGWDLIHNELDHFNLRTEWTVNADLAIAAEYRHRSAFDWRKADHTNFILDSFRSISRLRHSQLSDRRDTLLFHLFFRFHPCWAVELESRHGWNRFHEPTYNEFEIDLFGRLRSTWNFRLSYQHKEDDDRVSVYINMGIRRPDLEYICEEVPFARF